MKTLKRMKQRKTPSYKGSQGAILIVSLVLLLVMTLVGIASIDSSSMQSQMSRNSQFAQTLYQISRSEIEAQHELLKGIVYLSRVMESSFTEGLDTYIGFELTDSYVEIPDPKNIYDQAVRITFTGDSTPPSGYSVNTFTGKDFEVTPVTQVNGTGSISDQTQGMTYPAPL
ncbi:MAG: hypothetical protein JKY66_04080 [Spongiibacteraceae bacterium]|nr:hypothetical protein [Spongiibacteraceae bacterium]